MKRETQNSLLFPKAHGVQRGSILLEVMVAVAVFSFGILGIISLQATTVKLTTETKERLDAAFLATQIVGKFWVGDESLAGTHALSGLPNGQSVVTKTGNEVRVVVSWQTPGGTAHNFELLTQVAKN